MFFFYIDNIVILDLIILEYLIMSIKKLRTIILKIISSQIFAKEKSIPNLRIKYLNIILKIGAFFKCKEKNSERNLLF